MQKILVCDDDHEIVEAISIYLSGEGFEVLKAYESMKGSLRLSGHYTDYGE